MGYYRAGYDVTGVDIEPQERYPFRFIQADALEMDSYLWSMEYDAVHASPPCQASSDLKWMWNARPHADLISPTRELLKASGLPYIIENVEGAKLISPVVLCGSMFGLGVARFYLGRYRDKYEEPRAVIGRYAQVVEPRRTRERSFCCGAGGGQMFLGEEKGKRVNVARVEELVGTGAAVIGTACPFCQTMFRDALAAVSTNPPQLMDIVQIAARAIEKSG